MSWFEATWLATLCLLALIIALALIVGWVYLCERLTKGNGWGPILGAALPIFVLLVVMFKNSPTM